MCIASRVPASVGARAGPPALRPPAPPRVRRRAPWAARSPPGHCHPRALTAVRVAARIRAVVRALTLLQTRYDDAQWPRREALDRVLARGCLVARRPRGAD